MHQTTIRFGHELWGTLELAAETGGVSVAQYVREAAIERLARSGAFGDGGEISRDSINETETDLAQSEDEIDGVVGHDNAGLRPA